jgi:hypothetical protein
VKARFNSTADTTQAGALFRRTPGEDRPVHIDQGG